MFRLGSELTPQKQLKEEAEMVMQQLMTFVQYTAVSMPVKRNSAYACHLPEICMLNSWHCLCHWSVYLSIILGMCYSLNRTEGKLCSGLVWNSLITLISYIGNITIHYKQNNNHMKKIKLSQLLGNQMRFSRIHLCFMLLTCCVNLR